MNAQNKDHKGRLYRSPFVTRWASEKMLEQWGDLKKFRLWRDLWIALAESEKELGLEISDEAIEQMREYRGDVDLGRASEIEKELRHDVMAHVHTYGEQCPAAKGIIHLGATSCFVADNADLIRVRESLQLLIEPIATACRQLSDFALEYADLPCLGLTHYQPAQLTTVGKRACLWLQDLVGALRDISDMAENVPFRGVKGTTGTQASYLALFDGDEEKVCELEQKVAQKMGFDRVFPVTGQTYPRKYDHELLSTLASFGVGCHKMAADIRLLAGGKEVEEPFGKKQVGSSAMAYKRNPMRCERMTALSRFLINNVQNAAFTGADQWMERTLDDSANRRLSLAEGFLAADAVAQLAANISDGLVVNSGVVAERVAKELPFMATENIIMAAVKAGGDRQKLHERIRQHSMAAARRVKKEGGENDLLERIQKDDTFSAVKGRLEEIVDPRSFTGRAGQQVKDFVRTDVEPTLERFEGIGGEETELRV
ncbi:MAG: adenylosuccinate lyase [Candidatus Brocadiia bacterium]